MEINFKRIILFCADVERLVTFYQQFTGWTIIGEQTKDWTVLNAGGMEIAFHKIGVQYQNVPPEEFIVDNNIKLVFEVAADLPALRKSLLDQQVDISEIRQFPGSAYLVCDGRDPEGNMFQLVQVI